MLSKIYSAAILGVDGYLIQVEVDMINGLPGMTVVGLPDPAVKESRERVRSAIRNSGFIMPIKRITVNMAPANTKKSGPVFDLAISLGILAASEQIPNTNLNQFLIIGELSLDGSVRGVQGVLPCVIAARNAGLKNIIIPLNNAKEAGLVQDIKSFPVRNLIEAIKVLEQPEKITPFNYIIPEEPTSFSLDFREVKGQTFAKRGLEIAAAGNHNVIMIGSPGSGKSMLARRLPTVLPPMTFNEALETSKIYSAAGRLKSGPGLITKRPFRAPHHSITPAGLLGGSSVPKPGEISLAHHGVLFLDELLEFRRGNLELLRQPLEEQTITIARSHFSLSYPCDVLLVAACNPCLCGFFGDWKKSCICSHSQIERYWRRLSGPLLDRIDIHLEVPRLKEDELVSAHFSESSYEIRSRVVQARNLQLKRFEGSSVVANAQMSPGQINQFCQLNSVSKNLLKQAICQLGLSARAYHRILKLSRTIADLGLCKHIKEEHISEAIQFRTLDRQNSFSL